MSSLRIEAPVLNQPQGSRLWSFFIVLAVIILVGAAAWFFLGRKAPAPSLQLEIANFTGKPQFFSAADKRWRLLSRSDLLRNGDKLITAAGEEIDLKVTDLLFMRVKENSVLMNGGFGFHDKRNALPVYRLKLDEGTILGATASNFKQKAQLHIATPEAVVSAFDTTFEVRAGSKTSWVGVLKGVGELRLPPFYNEVTVLKNLRRTEIKGNKISEPIQVTREEWDHMKEAYELIPRGGAHEAEQIDLAKKAGTLYDYVFDHGTFYTPDIGYALRDFIPNEATGRTELNLEYDVFPRGSYVGMYMKARGLDLSKFNNLEFDVRIAPDADELKEFQIEMKSRGSVVRRMAAKMFTKEWKSFSFPLQASRETPIQEINFLFSNEKVGDYKKGVIQIRNINLTDKPAPSKTAVPVMTPNKKPALPDLKRPEVAVALPSVKTEASSAAGKVQKIAQEVVTKSKAVPSLPTLTPTSGSATAPLRKADNVSPGPAVSQASPDIFPEDF